MINLFVADLDGCISYPFESPDWDALSKIRALNRRSRGEDGIPSLTLCSGRPLPYVEAVAQMLDVQLPFIFEGGGGLYDARSNRLTWSDHFDDQRRRQIKQLKKWVKREIIDQYEGTIPEFAKKSDVGLINPDTALIEEMHRKIEDHVADHYDHFETHHTDVSINIVIKKCNKGAALEQLSELTDIPLDRMAYIGDGTNDISALKKVGFPFAPLNAREETKRHASVINREATHAVLEVYEQIRNLTLEI